MTYFLKSGNTFRVSAKEALDLHETLPAGNYVLKQDQYGNFFLEKVEDFEFKGKVYGNTTRHADRILNTFKDRGASTGVMLTGEKGSGKTLLTKKIAMDAALEGIPTIIINTAFHGDVFNTFLQTIEQPTIILFDEFEKVYKTEQQPAILTLLDGVFNSKKLFLLTCNDKWRVDRHLRNRPGRIFYLIEFKGIDSNFIHEYCLDNLKDMSHVDSICRIASLFEQFNFDMLKALIEEMNRYGENPQQVLEILNAKPEQAEDSNFKVSLVVNGVTLKDEDISNKTWEGNPLSDDFSIHYQCLSAEPKDEHDYEWTHTDFEPADIKHVSFSPDQFFYVKGNVKLTLTRNTRKTFNYNAL